MLTACGQNRVAACHDSNNPKSGRVMDKAGMKLEGTLRAAGKNNQGICDEVWHSILKEDYEMNMERGEKMDNQAEQERKALNKKLLKRTFDSELKSKRKVKCMEIVIDFVAIFIAYFLSDLIVERFSIVLPFIELIIRVGLVMMMLFIGLRFSRMLGRNKS